MGLWLPCCGLLWFLWFLRLSVEDHWPSAGLCGHIMPTLSRQRIYCSKVDKWPLNGRPVPAKLVLMEVTGVTSLSNICSVGPFGALWCSLVLDPRIILACTGQSVLIQPHHGRPLPIIPTTLLPLYRPLSTTIPRYNAVHNIYRGAQCFPRSSSLFSLNYVVLHSKVFQTLSWESLSFFLLVPTYPPRSSLTLTLLFHSFILHEEVAIEKLLP